MIMLGREGNGNGNGSAIEFDFQSSFLHQRRYSF